MKNFIDSVSLKSLKKKIGADFIGVCALLLGIHTEFKENVPGKEIIIVAAIIVSSLYMILIHDELIELLPKKYIRITKNFVFMFLLIDIIFVLDFILKWDFFVCCSYIFDHNKIRIISERSICWFRLLHITLSLLLSYLCFELWIFLKKKDIYAIKEAGITVILFTFIFLIFSVLDVLFGWNYIFISANVLAITKNVLWNIVGYFLIFSAIIFYLIYSILVIYDYNKI